MRLARVAAVAAGVLLLTGCGSAAARSSYSPTVTVVPSPTDRFTSPATPVGTPTPIPSGQCADAALRVRVTPADGGGGAGNVEYRVVFTNTGDAPCALRGAPKVSVATADGGKLLGRPADRVQTGARTVRIPAGGAAAAPLRVVDLGDSGGPLDDCTVTEGAGYLVAAPRSSAEVFVADADAVACDPGPVFMTVGPVLLVTD